MVHPKSWRAAWAAAAAILFLASVHPVYASQEATGTGVLQCPVAIEGEIVPLTLSITHPVAVTWTIDPNAAQPFAAPDFCIQNNSKARVRVTVQSLAAVEQPVLDDPEEVLLQDVAPDAYEWPALNAADSMRYIALGLFARADSGWDTGACEDTLYAVEIEDNLLGKLAASGAGDMGLTACHGLAISQSFAAAHTLVLAFAID